jgi:hypothetical protein
MVGEIKQKLRGYVMRERGLIPLDILLIGVLVVALSMDLHAGIGMSAYPIGAKNFPIFLNLSVQ